MKLSDLITKNNLNILLSIKELSGDKKTLLTNINRIAADDGFPLAQQGDELTNIIFKLLDTQKNDLTLESTARQIYAKIQEESQKQTFNNQKTHHAQGNFNAIALHQRPLKDLLQDHDMLFLMPKSSQTIDILATINRFDKASIGAVQDNDGMRNAMSNPAIKHIIIPVGPGHWRGVYLSKPEHPDDTYTVEIFDSKGADSGRVIEEFIEEILKNVNLSHAKITFSDETALKHPQKDIYACGDYVCAYTHKFIKKCGRPSSEYNQILIDVLDDSGNKDNKLRNTTRLLTIPSNQSHQQPGLVMITPILEEDPTLGTVPVIATENDRLSVSPDNEAQIQPVENEPLIKTIVPVNEDNSASTLIAIATINHHETNPSLNLVDKNNYSFLLKAAAYLSAGLAIAAFTSIALALTAFITLSTVGIGLIAGIGMVATASSVGLFKKTSTKPDNANSLPDPELIPIDHLNSSQV